MRLFLAIDLPAEAVALLVGLQRHIRGGRPVPPDNMHLTLAYLGDQVPDNVAEDIHLALEAKSLGRPEFRLRGIGHFGSAAPRQIWIGAEPRDGLAAVHDRIVQMARRAGCEVPKRRFQPHVTLARFSEGDPSAVESLTRLFERGGAVSSGPINPAAYHLYRSHLGTSGPSYERLATYPFRSAR